MKKWGWIFWILIIFIAALFYFGIFDKIEIQEKEVGPFKVIYETHTGDYAKVGEIQDKIYNSLLNDGIETSRGFGIYYDNPREVKKEQLRSEVGVIIEEKDYSKIGGLNGKYNVKSIPKTNSVMTTFPFRHKISIAIGVFKVYPKLQKYITEMGYKPSLAMEIYDNSNNKIIYLFEIIK